MKNLIQKTRNHINSMLLNENAASLWEYLLVIAIVCIIGGILIGVLKDNNNGIAHLWELLYTKFAGLLQ